MSLNLTTPSVYVCECMHLCMQVSSRKPFSLLYYFAFQFSQNSFPLESLKLLCVCVCVCEISEII